MFDIGFSELLIIAVVALLVLGPERLPRAARFAGLWMRRARAQWYSVKSELENELAADELRRSLRETQDELRDAQQRMQREGESLRQELSGDMYAVQPGKPAPADNAAAQPVARSSDSLPRPAVPSEGDALTPDDSEPGYRDER